jgi:hypothetical protein
MTFGPGIGARGDVGIEHINFHPVKTTWQQTIRMALGLTIGYVCLLLAAVLIIAYGWGWALVWWLIRYLLEMLLVTPVIIWGYSFVRAVYLYYAVVQKSPNWPPPQSQVDPLASGIVDAYHFPTYEPEQPDVIVHQFEGSVKNGNGQSKHHRLNTSHPDEWQAFAKLLTADLRILRCRFSVRAARRFRVPEDEFDNLQKAWARIGFAERTSRATNAHYKLTSYGFEWMREFANTPLP